MDQKTEDKITKSIETGTLKKPMDKTNTGSTFHTSTTQKRPHPKLGMMGGRKPQTPPLRAHLRRK